MTPIGFGLDPVAHWTATGLLAFVFGRAVLGKLAEPGLAAATLRAYRIVPEALVHPATALLIIAEAFTLGLLAWPALHGLAGLAAAALLSLYALAMALALRAGRTEIECGCGGSGQVVSGALVGRNLVLILAALLLCLPVSGRAVGLVDAVIAISGALVAALILASGEKAAENAHAARRLRDESYLPGHG